MRRTALLAAILVLANLAGVLHAGLVSRPAKTCGQTTYDAEVANGCVTIKSNEVDADLNAIITGGVNNIETANINASGLGTAAYADGSVTEPKLANGAVSSTKIADGTIVDADVNAAAAIKGSKLADAPDGITTTKLNDNSVTLAKIDPQSTVRVRVGGIVTAGLSIGPGTETTIVSVLTTTFSGEVFFTGTASVQWTTIGSGTGTATVRYKVDGVTDRTVDFNLAHDGAENSFIPIGASVHLDAAGVHTYTITVELAGGSAGTISTPAANAGLFFVYEPA